MKRSKTDLVGAARTDASQGRGNWLMPTRRGFMLMSGAAAAGMVARPAFAASSYPNKSVHFVVSSAAGSGTDIIGRIVAKQLSKELDAAFIVENHTGAGGVVGTEFVAQAEPDGYTELVMDTGMSISASTHKSLPYDVLKDFTPITQISSVPLLLVVNPSLGIKSIQDLIDYARANPGKLNYGSSGVGGSIQVYFERFKAATGIDITHIPYAGGSRMLAAALRNDVQLLMTAIATTRAYVKNDQLLPLAITAGDKRLPSMPDVPTMKEAGIKDMEMYSWSGLGGPAGLPKDVVDFLHKGVVKALADPSVKKWFASQDTDTVGSSPEEFTKFFHDQVETWAKVIKEAGIPVNQ